MSNQNSWVKTQNQNKATKNAIKIVMVEVERLFKLNKSQQEKILNNNGIKEIPKTEIERVSKIIQLEANKW